MVRAPADGYTLIVNSVGPMAINASFYKSLGYDPLVELVPIVQFADVRNVLVVPPSLNVKAIQELVANTKANPATANYAPTGTGTFSHLAGFLLAKKAGFSATHVPCKGTGAVVDLLAGRVQFMFVTIPSVIGHIRAGNLTAIAVIVVVGARAVAKSRPILFSDRHEGAGLTRVVGGAYDRLHADSA